MTGLGLLEMVICGFMWNLELLLRKKMKEDGTQLKESQNLGSRIIVYEVFSGCAKALQYDYY